MNVNRPYLHVYAHSDEKEETAVIGLNGVNIEFNPEMEALLGVRRSSCHQEYDRKLTIAPLFFQPETLHIHSFHRI